MYSICNMSLVKRMVIIVKDALLPNNTPTK